jgi:hypothetical protein
VVEGKNSETGTEKREEGNMGNSAAEINLGTVEKSEKGKEKKLESENHAELKWEDFVAMLNEGIINMKMMRDVLEDIKGKLEILDQIKGLGCREIGLGRKDPQQGIIEAKIQLGQGENGPRPNKPSLCCSKTYYRKRYCAVALRKATRMPRREQKGPKLSLEGSKSSSEASRRDATELISDGDTNHDLETTEKLTPAREEVPMMDEKPVIGGGSSREEGQASGKSHEAGQVMGQLQYSTLANRSNETHTRRSSAETIQVLSTPPIIPEKMKGDNLVGQDAKASVVREDSCLIIIPEITISVAESTNVDKEKTKGRMEQKVTTNLSERVGSFAGDKSGTCEMETEEVLGVGDSEVGDEGLEDVIPETISWVVDSCLEFYPKVGITCEGEEKNMKMLVEDIANGRQQPVVEERGIPTSSRGFDCYVNYDRGMSEV